MPRILLIEDDLSIREVIQMALEYEGFAVHVAENGSDALRILENDRPDLILLDLLMPKMNGSDFLQALRTHSNPAVASLPVVITSATETKSDVVLKQIQGVLTKPLKLEDLIETVSRFCKRE